MPQDPSVYILGAGMSVEAGIPAMNRLTNLVLSEKYMIGGANLLANFCGFAFPDLHVQMDMDGAVTAQPEFVLNVEQFMSSLDAFRAYSDVTGTWKGLLISPERINPLFVHVVGRAITDLTPDEVAPYYLNFASTLKPGDSVITLNWDCLLERACDAANIRWTYPQLHAQHGQQHAIVDNKTVTIIKLHGSVDWRNARPDLEFDQILHSIDGEPAVVRTDVPLREEESQFTAAGGHGGLILEGTPFGAGPLNVHVAETPFIIPPSHFKEFPDKGLPGLLWTCAARALRSAARVTVVGYSLPLTDYVPRWLLRLGLLFNRFTGPRLVREYLGYPQEAELDAFDSQYFTEANITQLHLQAMLHGDQNIRQCWDRACIPIDVVNPDPQSEKHFKRMISLNVNYHNATAGAYYA